MTARPGAGSTLLLQRVALWLKQAVFYLNDLSAAVVYVLRGQRPRAGLTVLCYHRVADRVPRFPPYNPYNVRPDRLARQIEAARALSGVTVVTLEDVARWVENGPPASGSYLLFTFDDCWEHTTEVARRLAEARIRAAFFVPTGFVGAPVFEFSSFDRWYARQPDADSNVYAPITEQGCRSLLDLGMDVQPHGHRHLHLGTEPAQAMRADIDESISFVQTRLRRDVRAFCYPFGSWHLGDYTSAVIDVLRRTPVVVAFSTDAGVNELGTLSLRRHALKRVPVNSYDGGILFQAKASGYSGALPAMKAFVHRIRRPAAQTAALSDPLTPARSA